MIDDSGHPQFDGADWPWVVNQTFPPPDSATCAQIDPLNVRQQILGPFADMLHFSGWIAVSQVSHLLTALERSVSLGTGYFTHCFVQCIPTLHMFILV